MVVFQLFQEAFDLNLLVNQEWRVALKLLREFLYLFLRGLEAVQPDLVPLSDFCEVLSLVHIEDLVSSQEILEELRRNMKVMLGLEEVVFRESYGVLMNLHRNHDNIISLIQALILEKLKLHNVFLIMNG
jgi:hypothetical protein